MPLVATWYATGNNVAILADTGRRICHVRLESPDERPEERSDFRHADLLQWVRQERGRLLAAALTILSGYCRAGRPDMQLKAWGSYDPWTALVRNAVVWAGMPDPGQTRQEFRQHSDREVESLRGLLDGWQEIDPSRDGKTAGQVIAYLKAKGNEEHLPRLREVLADLFDLPQGKLPTSGRLGCLLRKFRGRNVGGVCFDSREAHGGVQAWFVRPVGTACSAPARPQECTTGGDGGDGGDVSAVSANGHGQAPICPARGNIPTIPTIPTGRGEDLAEGTI